MGGSANSKADTSETVKKIKHIESLAHPFSVVLIILFPQIHFDIAIYPGQVKARAERRKEKDLFLQDLHICG